MRELNLLEGYPQPKEIRYVGENIRTINHRIIAAYRDKEFFDGDRNCGYGGYKYDGRWKKVATKIKNEYQLDENASFLQLNCEKGFLLHDITNLNNLTQVFGTETSPYAIQESLKSIKANVIQADPTGLPFEDNFFDYIYIDAEHTFKAVTKDLEVWYPKLKKNGTLFGDDYYWREEDDTLSLHIAYQEFIKKNHIKKWCVFKSQIKIIKDE